MDAPYDVAAARARFRRMSGVTPPLDVSEPQQPMRDVADLRRDAVEVAWNEFKAIKSPDFNFFTEGGWNIDGGKWRKQFSMGSKTVKNTIQMTFAVEFEPESATIRKAKPEYR